jgi:hypothetical protein
VMLVDAGRPRGALPLGKSPLLEAVPLVLSVDRSPSRATVADRGIEAADQVASARGGSASTLFLSHRINILESGWALDLWRTRPRDGKVTRAGWHYWVVGKGHLLCPCSWRSYPRVGERSSREAVAPRGAAPLD